MLGAVYSWDFSDFTTGIVSYTNEICKRLYRKHSTKMYKKLIVMGRLIIQIHSGYIDLAVGGSKCDKLYKMSYKVRTQRHSVNKNSELYLYIK